MKNNIINELKFASKKKKNAVLGYIYCDYLLDMFEEIERLNNIINELEKAIIKFKKQIEEERKNHLEIIGNFVDKVREIKGSNGNEENNQ